MVVNWTIKSAKGTAGGIEHSSLLSCCTVPLSQSLERCALENHSGCLASAVPAAYDTQLPLQHSSLNEYHKHCADKVNQPISVLLKRPNKKILPLAPLYIYMN